MRCGIRYVNSIGKINRRLAPGELGQGCEQKRPPTVFASMAAGVTMRPTVPSQPKRARAINGALVFFASQLNRATTHRRTFLVKTGSGN